MYANRRLRRHAISWSGANTDRMLRDNARAKLLTSNFDDIHLHQRVNLRRLSLSGILFNDGIICDLDQ